MKITRFKSRHGKTTKLDSYMIRMTEAEALSTILSLTEQVLKKNSNSGRKEMYSSDKGEYFSIVVDLV